MYGWKKFIMSFGYALKGLKIAAAERNFVIQLAFGASAIVLALALKVSDTQKMIVVLCTALVLGSEAMNSATERLLDFVSKEHHKEIAEIKDLMAASVFIFSIAAFIVGIWIFGNALFF